MSSVFLLAETGELVGWYVWAHADVDIVAVARDSFRSADRQRL